MPKWQFNEILKENRYVALVFLGLTLILRFTTLFPSVIDHDESTYLVIGQALLQGETYWIDVIDTKPVGIFLLFAAFEWLFGYHIWVVRLLAIGFIATTSWLLFRFNLSLGSDRNAAFASGIIYIFMVSTYTYYGVSPNTEVFFLSLTMAAFLLLSTPSVVYKLIVAGLLMGLAFIIKPVVFFEILAALVFLFVRSQRLDKFFLRAVIFGLSTMIPFFTVWAYYLAIDQGEVFHYFTFEIGQRYLSSSTLADNLLFIGEFLARFAPVSLMCIYVLWKSKHIQHKYRIFAIVWTLLVWAAILLTGKRFAHYTIQVMVPMSIIAGWFFDRRFELNPATWLRRKKSIGYSLLALIGLISIGSHIEKFLVEPDVPRAVADYINKSLEETDLVYAGDYHHVIYTLTDRPCPIPYVHRSLVWKEMHSEVLQIDPVAMFDTLQDNERLKFILHDWRPAAIPDSSRYQLDTVIHDISVYKRKPN